MLQQNGPSNLTQYVHYGLRVSEFLANGMMMNNTLLRAFLHRLKNFETGLKKTGLNDARTGLRVFG